MQVHAIFHRLDCVALGEEARSLISDLEFLSERFSFENQLPFSIQHIPSNNTNSSPKCLHLSQ